MPFSCRTLSLESSVLMTWKCFCFRYVWNDCIWWTLMKNLIEFENEWIHCKPIPETCFSYVVCSLKVTSNNPSIKMIPWLYANLFKAFICGVFYIENIIVLFHLPVSTQTANHRACFWLCALDRKQQTASFLLHSHPKLKIYLSFIFNINLLD